jgi:hypothetical protein
MKSFLLILTLSGIISFCFHSCKDEPFEIPNDLVIVTRTYCGWCAIDDSLKIIPYMIGYVASHNCNLSTPDTIINVSMQKEELISLMKKLDMNKFIKCNLNTCYSCEDRCDWVLYIKADNRSHRIRFGYYEAQNDSTFRPIQPFLKQLFAIKKRYATKDGSTFTIN